MESGFLLSSLMVMVILFICNEGEFMKYLLILIVSLGLVTSTQADPGLEAELLEKSMGAVSEIGQNQTNTFLAGLFDGEIAKKLYNYCKSSVFSTIACVQATVAVAQSVENFASSRKSKKYASEISNNGEAVAEGSVAYNDSTSGLNSSTPVSTADLLAILSPELKEAFDHKIVNPYELSQKLKEEGYSFDPATGGVNTPGGFVPAGEVNAQAQKLAATDEFKEISKGLKRKVKKYLKLQRLKSSATGGYVGSPGAKSEVSSKSSRSSYSLSDFHFSNSTSQRKPSSTEVKMVNGDPLVSAGAQLFDVVGQAYRQLLQQKHLPESSK